VERQVEDDNLTFQKIAPKGGPLTSALALFPDAGPRDLARALLLRRQENGKAAKRRLFHIRGKSLRAYASRKADFDFRR
jgi:hypothetical protein